jgi:hypothetical protein
MIYVSRRRRPTGKDLSQLSHDFFFGAGGETGPSALVASPPERVLPAALESATSFI